MLLFSALKTFIHLNLPIMRRDFWLVFVVTIGITLSVALFISIRLANDSVITEFENMTSAVSGKDTLRISSVAETYVNESVITKISNLAGIKLILPYSKKLIKIKNLQGQLADLWLVGVDITYDSNATSNEGDTNSLELLQYKSAITTNLVIKEFGDQLSLKKDNPPINLLSQNREEELLEIYNGRVVIMDISLFQKLTETYGKLNEIHIRTDKSFIIDDIQNKIKYKLPDNYLVSSGDETLLRLSKSSEALRVNLTFLSALSLLVAIILTYQIVRVLLVRRRQIFSTVVSIGGSGRLLFLIVLIEATLIALIGSGFGLLIGRTLGTYTVQAVQTTVSTLYTPISDRQPELTVRLIFEGILLGVFAALLGAVISAYPLLTRPPKTYFSKNIIKEAQINSKYNVILAIIFFAACYFFSDTWFTKLNILAPFLSPLCLVFSTLLIAPIAMNFICFLASKTNSFSLNLASDFVRGRSIDNALTVGALAVAFGMLIGVLAMIDSFRVTFQSWLSKVLAADIFISSTNIPVSDYKKALEKLSSNKEIADISWGEEIRYLFKNNQIFIRSTNIDLLSEKKIIVLTSNVEPDWQGIKQGEKILISEPFSNKYQFRIGDTIELKLPLGLLTAEVGAVYQDFSTDMGAVLLPHEIFQRFIGEGQNGLGISIFLKDNSKISSVQESIASLLGTQWQVSNRRSLEKNALKIFDSTFLMTYVLQILTLILSCGLFMNSAALNILEKKRDWLTLKSIGAKFKNLRKIAIIESLLVVIASLLPGLLLGISLSFLLAYRVNVVFFGWVVGLSMPTMYIPIISLLLLGIAAISATIVSQVILKSLSVKELKYD